MRGFLLLSALMLAADASSQALGATHEVDVIKSYAACKSPETVRKFEEFEKADDDHSYKILYLSTSMSGECIFLRSNEIVRTLDETNGNYTCIFTNDPESSTNTDPSVCYWTATNALGKR